jgi:hypothetical protein
MITLRVVLLILAAATFLVAAFNKPAPVNLIAVGLLLWVLATVAG